MNFHTAVKKNNKHLSKELEHGLPNFTSHFLSQKNNRLLSEKKQFSSVTMRWLNGFPF